MSRKQPLHFADAFYDGQLQRTVGHVDAGMADVGEALAVARAVGPRPDPDRWHDAWADRAARVRAVARAAQPGAAAASAWLRTGEYERQASFFLRHDLADPRLRSAHRRHVAAFRAATEHLATDVERLPLTVDGAPLTAYRFAPAGGPVPRATVLLPCGYDSTAEEGWGSAAAAVARGYAAVTFEGPGQGQALLDGRTFRQEFEQVVSPLVDLLLARDDTGPLVLVGRSFAGFLALRAAAHDDRFAALVLDPAQAWMGAHVPPGPVGLLAPAVVGLRMRASTSAREFFGARMAAHGLTSPAGYLAELRRWDVRDQVGRIACPTLLVECEGDPVGGGGPAVAPLLTAPHDLVRLAATSGAGGHCGGLGQAVWADTVYSWLGGVLAGVPRGSAVEATAAR
jgi:hypothetical protein